ncbi:MAG: Holliday junction resolvase-like protein [Candidatus Gracilibacteria bacterium]|nr:Holliday junction resolvase-like protein [Candidatus Gracilibacteria bacterium]
MDIVALLIGIIFGFIIGFLWVQIQRIGVEKKIRQDAVRGSRNAITGEIYEKILPSMPNFPYAPKDMVFVGKGTDYIIFDGLSEGDLREIIFLEIKSGKSRLNANEKMIKKILDEKIVRFAEMRVGAPKNDE